MFPDVPARDTPPKLTTRSASPPPTAQSTSPINYIAPTMSFSSSIPTPLPTLSSTPRRSTITGFRALPSPPLPLSLPVSTLPGACTHINVTRLYTTEFACQMCGEFGSMGWLFRCVQDRENMLEHDLQANCADKLDALCNDLLTSNFPKKRSAAARESPLSLLDEMTEEQLATYTPSQIVFLLKQRAHLQKVLAATDVLASQTPTFQPTNIPSNNSFQFPPSPSPLKPWVPLKECQFKVCVRCRGSFKEKSYLSLNAIMNGDVPATASTGFGFHLMGERPVVDAKIVRGLGLRQNPVVRDDSSCASDLPSDEWESDSSASPPQLQTKIKRRIAHLNLATYGLGINSHTPNLNENDTPDRPNTPNNLIYSADDIGRSAGEPDDWYKQPSGSGLLGSSTTESKDEKEEETGVASHDFAYPSSFVAPSRTESTTTLFKPRPSRLPIRRSSPSFPSATSSISIRKSSPSFPVSISTSSLIPTPTIILTPSSDTENEDVNDGASSDTVIDSSSEAEVDSDSSGGNGKRNNPHYRKQPTRIVTPYASHRDLHMKKGVNMTKSIEDAGGEGNTFSPNPVTVEGGVAVTEEAVELGVPDVLVR